MREGGTILALDLATAFGWASGSPGSTPFVGSGRFAPEGSSPAAVCAGAIEWFSDRLAVDPPSAIFIERPKLHSVQQGKSAFGVIYALLGLCYTLEGVAYLRGCYRVQMVEVAKVRTHFIGHGNRPGEEAKRLVARRCDDLGWSYKNNDESDALAIWDFACETIRRGSGHPATPGLFNLPKLVRKPKAPAGDRISAKDARDLFAKPRRR